MSLSFFSRLLIRCLLIFITLSLIFSYFTCKATKHSINKSCFLTHSSPFPRPCNNTCADFKLFWYSYHFGIHQKEFWQKEFFKKIKINIDISSGNTIINSIILYTIINTWINQLKLSRNWELQCVIPQMKTKEEVPIYLKLQNFVLCCVCAPACIHTYTECQWNGL